MQTAVETQAREHGGETHVMNAVDLPFVLPIFDGAYATGADYLNMAMSLSHPHPDRPYQQTGVKLSYEQFATSSTWKDSGRWRWSVSASSRGCQTSSPATPPTSSSLRSTSEVLLMPRWVDARRVTYKYGLGTELDARGRTCAGLWLTGTGMDGQTRDVYLYHVVDRTQARPPHDEQTRPAGQELSRCGAASALVGSASSPTPRVADLSSPRADRLTAAVRDGDRV
ncbi:MAG TPA: hypothetical protein VFI46_10750, partial [Jiangellaceae bacterium]|nr:hypothetical protein [Jiangellaceae bacterium]